MFGGASTPPLSGARVLELAASDGRLIGFLQKDRHDGNLVQIPQFDTRVAAGAGLVPAEEKVIAHFAVDRDWLRRLLPAWAIGGAVVGILEGQGDSMQPTIRDGDLIMVANDPPAWAIERGGIFVILHHDELRIKRLQRIARTGDIRIISDNPAYEPEIVERDRIEFDLRVLAQVFFSGGSLRNFANGKLQD